MAYRTDDPGSGGGDPWQSAPLDDPPPPPPADPYYPPPDPEPYYPPSPPPAYYPPAPTYQQPAYQQPTYQPTYQQPTYQQPTYQDPVQQAPAPAPYTPTPIDANAIYQMQLELQRINQQQAASLAASRAAAQAPAPQAPSYQSPAPTQQAPAPTYASPPQPSPAMETFTRASSYQAAGPDPNATYVPAPPGGSVGGDTAFAPAPADAAASARAQWIAERSGLGNSSSVPAATPAVPSAGAAATPAVPPATPGQSDVFRQGSANTQRAGGPHFLPGEDTPFGALSAKGMVPPFLSRLFAQAKGDPTQGTDRPQFTNIPSEVPLVSKLAWTQMQPTEQQAFLSYVSSYGITPEDYFSMVESSSPQGGRTPGRGFGSSFGRYNQ